MPVVMLNYSNPVSGGPPPPQTPTYVQGRTLQNGATSTNTMSMALTNPVGSGNLIVVTLGFAAAGGETVTFTDNLSNTYTTAITLIFNAVAGYAVASAYLPNITNGPQTLIATISGAKTFLTMVADEWSGLAPTSVLDVAATGQAQSSVPGTTDAITSGTITTVTNGDLIYGFGVSINSVGFAYGTGFTGEQGVGNTFFTEFLLQSAAGLTAATFTPTSGDSTIAYVLALKHG